MKDKLVGASSRDKMDRRKLELRLVLTRDED
jgi:hypothetical protein